MPERRRTLRTELPIPIVRREGAYGRVPPPATGALHLRNRKLENVRSFAAKQKRTQKCQRRGGSAFGSEESRPTPAAAAATQGRMSALQNMAPFRLEVSQSKERQTGARTPCCSAGTLQSRHETVLITAPTALAQRYFAEFEFTTEHQLCCSDCEPLTMQDVLDVADDECKELCGGPAERRRASPLRLLLSR